MKTTIKIFLAIMLMVGVSSCNSEKAPKVTAVEEQDLPDVRFLTATFEDGTVLQFANGINEPGILNLYRCFAIPSNGKVVIPEKLNVKGVTYSIACILPDVFAETKITSITIPNSVTVIGSSAFEECTELTSVTMPDKCERIGEMAFALCTSLTSITMPDKCERIGDKAFAGCNSLASVIIPEGVSIIYENTFAGCTGLTSITIPNSVIEIEEGAFNYCTGLKKIEVAKGNNHYDSRNHCNAIIETATNTLLRGCSNTVIPDNIKIIGDVAFVGCADLTSVAIPEGVPIIYENTFAGCTGLTSITIPNSVIEIEEGAFNYCTGLKKIEIEKGNNHYDSRNHCNAIIETATNRLLRGCNNTVIPDNVQSIGEKAFNGCTGLTSINIPNSVTEIGYAAFAGCAGLTSINIPNSITRIRDNVFNGCTGLTSINIPNSVTRIGNGAFSGCAGLTSITIPNSVVEIDNWAFSDCAGMKKILVSDGNRKYDSRNHCNAIIETATNTLISGCSNTVIPSSVTSIGDGAFQGCVDLTSIPIPNSVMEIGYNAFENCKGLTSIAIPSSVTSIRDRAFRGCEDLTSITIPNSVTEIGLGVFDNCTGLISVITQSPDFLGSSNEWEWNAWEWIKSLYFSGCEKLQPSNVIYQPVGKSVSTNDNNAIPSYATEQGQMVYSNAYDGFLNIRQAPNGGARILGVLKNGPDGATLLGSEGEWKKIDYHGLVGYVFEKYVQYTPTEVFKGE